MGKMMDYLGGSMKRFINRGLLDLKVQLRTLDKADPMDGAVNQHHLLMVHLSIL